MRTAAAMLRTGACLLLPMLAAGCGAGLITGLVANQNNSPTAEVRPPELSLSPLLPLVPAGGTTRSVVVTNAQIPASAQLRVEIEALGVTAVQPDPTVSGQGGSTVVAFTLETGPIVMATGDPTVADVAGLFRVFVDGALVAAAVPIVLVRQPRATLVLPAGANELLLAPSGQVVSLRLTGLRSSDPTAVQMFVTVPDPTLPAGSGDPRTVTRLCTGLQLGPAGAPGEAIVTASVPGNGFPVGAQLFVRDAVAGQSTAVTDAYYRPDIALALPRQGPTTGGNLVTVIGRALVPYDFTAAGLPALAFPDVELAFVKGGRVTVLPREDFRTEQSDLDRLVFRMPQAPDGRPGEVDLVLRVRLGAVIAEVVASQEFLFANPYPFFGPRGAVLDTSPVAVAPIPLDGAPGGDDAPDFAVLTEEGGVGFLQLLLAQENGMFQRFGARRQIGDHQVAAERGPRDLCTGDFDGDGVPDLFIANAGAATAVHHLVLGQARPQAPLGAVHRLAGEPGTGRSRVAAFDGDALPDLLLVPGPGAPAGLLPQVRLARPVAIGQPAFAAAVSVPVRNFPYEATEVADLDGDGFQDVAVVSGTTLQLDVAFGRGDGTFEPAVAVDFSIPGYVADPASPAIGLHACRNGSRQSLALVMAGLDYPTPGNGPSPPLIAVLDQTAARIFAAPDPAGVQVIPTNPLQVSLAADVDGANTVEIAVGVRGVPTVASLGLLRFNGSAFQPVAGGVETGAELPQFITALHFGRAFPATPQTGEAKAVFVVHESVIDGTSERRLSTRLLFAAGQSLTLLPPDAGAVWDDVVDGIVGGDFHDSGPGASSVRDLALARPGVVDLLQNDGFGGFPVPSNSLAATGLLPRTLALLPAVGTAVDALVFLDDRSRLGVWRHDPAGAAVQAPTWLTAELRLAAAAPHLQAAALADTTRMRVADVDGDGTADLVVLLSFALPAQGEGDALLALLRGKPAPGPGEFPFVVPTVLLPVHGKASALALGDFAAAGPGLPVRLELAVAVPEGTTPGALDGDQVRFFRYAAGAVPELDRFEPSAEPGGPQVLLAGSQPTQVEAGDFDDDGLVDLLVAAAGDDTLRLFRNIAPPQGAQGHVAVGSFVESLASPRPLAPGLPRALRLGDVNGDGSIDAIATVETLSTANVRSTAVAFYLRSDPGVFADPVFVSPMRVGNRDARMALDLGDWNRDGVLDLFLGWNTVGVGDRNVRVLFGGSR